MAGGLTRCSETLEKENNNGTKLTRQHVSQTGMVVEDMLKKMMDQMHNLHKDVKRVDGKIDLRFAELKSKLEDVKGRVNKQTSLRESAK